MVERLTLYRAPTTVADADEIADWLRERLRGDGCEVDLAEGFCEASGCRLSNPHRQPGVVAAQLRDPEFCEAHAELYE